MPSRIRSKPSTHSLESIVAAVALFCATSTIPLVAQHAQGASSPKYDAQTETKMRGTVDDVRLPSSAKEIVYLVLKTDGGPSVEVYVCPKSFLDDMGVAFAKGDQIDLNGSKVKRGDTDLILAREIVKKTDTLVLRDDKGKPVWN